MAPAETALRADLTSSRFKLAECRGKWALVNLTFPVMLVRLRAAPRRDSPDWFLMRIDCQGYRAMAPTGQLWNGPLNAPLDPALRPYTAAGLMTIFSTYKPCLYHPIDRMARDHWPNQHADLAWSADKDITSYLEVVYEALHDPQYLVSKAPAAAAYLPQETVALHPG